MATRFGFRLAKAREGSQHSVCQCDICLRTRMACCPSAAFGTWSGSLVQWRKSEPGAEQRSSKRTVQELGKLIDAVGRYVAMNN